MIKQIKSAWLKRLWPHHFARQIVLLTSITIVISTAILTSYQITEVNKFQYENAQEMLGSIAENITLGVTHPLIIKDYAEIENLLRRAAIFPGIRSITLVDPSGRVISAVRHEAAKPVEPVFSRVQLAPPQHQSTSYQWIYGTSGHANPLAMGMDATALTIWHPI